MLKAGRAQAKCAIAQRLHFEHVARSNFPLTRLGCTLKGIRDTGYNGFGFTILRGLDVNKFSHEDRAIVFLGLSSYIAEDRGAQDRRGTMLSPFKCRAGQCLLG
jgi:hypothetical protein